jgi:hypothetical protein
MLSARYNEVGAGPYANDESRDVTQSVRRWLHDGCIFCISLMNLEVQPGRGWVILPFMVSLP